MMQSSLNPSDDDPFDSRSRTSEPLGSESVNSGSLNTEFLNAEPLNTVSHSPKDMPRKEGGLHDTSAVADHEVTSPKLNQLPLENVQGPQRKPLAEVLSHLVGHRDQFLEAIHSIVSIDERLGESSDIVSPNLSLARALVQLLKSERELVMKCEQADLDRLQLLALASAQVLDPIKATEANRSCEIRADLTREIVSCSALVSAHSDCQRASQRTFVDALSMLANGGHLFKELIQDLSERNRAALVSIVSAEIIEAREDGFPHLLPNDEIEFFSYRLIGLVVIADRLKLYEVFGEIDGLSRDVHGWNLAHSDRYSMMGGMHFGSSSESEYFSVSEYSPDFSVDLGESSSESIAAWTSFQQGIGDFSLYSNQSIDHMEDLMLALVRSMGNLSAFISRDSDQGATCGFLENALIDFRIGWVAWSSCLRTLTKISETGLELARDLVADLLIQPLLSSDTTAHVVLCEFIERDRLALQLVVDVVNELSEPDRKQLFEEMQRNEEELIKEFHGSFSPMLKVLRQLTQS